MPLVSIIIPTYNRERLVQDTIDNVFGQTFTDWELIIIDDGSTDNTQAVLNKRYGDTIRYVYQENQGESAARNHGLGLASGKYLAFLDSDDLWSPIKLECQVAVLEAEHQVGLVYTRAYFINYEGLILRRLPDGHNQHTDTVTWADLVLDNVVAGGGSSATVRRECIERVGSFDERIRFGEEWDLWIRIARHFQVRQIAEPLCFYRLNPNGARTWAPRVDEAERLHLDHLAILYKAFRQCPNILDNREQLEAQAFARVYLKHAFVSYGLKRPEQGRQHWLTAIRLCPEYATNREVLWQQITNSVANFANVSAPNSQIGEAGEMLRCILSSLPAQVMPLRQDGERLFARILAELACLAAQNKDSYLARRCVLTCLRIDPGWIQNLGVLKILFTGGRHLWPQPIDWPALLNRARYRMDSAKH
jgi:glycosyltransferase involved in cell wall biosynthesis